MNTKTIRSRWDIAIIDTDFKSTSLMDHFEIPYREIVAVFGKQNAKNDGYKTDAEWEINTPAGKGTIYNYKDGKNYLGEKGCIIENITDWHIGGENKECAEYIINELKKRNNGSRFEK